MCSIASPNRGAEGTIASTIASAFELAIAMATQRVLADVAWDDRLPSEGGHRPRCAVVLPIVRERPPTALSRTLRSWLLS
jgi:hypothetical protein